MSTPPDPDPATIAEINAMSHFDMCSLWRFAPSGHPWFDTSLPYAEVFRARLFGHFGGFTPEISKALPEGNTLALPAEGAASLKTEN